MEARIQNSMYTPSKSICGLTCAADTEEKFLELRRFLSESAQMKEKELSQMLNPKQERFCVEYLKSGHASSAYKSAFGIVNDGTARANASRLLKSVEIRKRLSELQAEINNEKILSAQELQERLSAIARREVYETITLPTGQQVQKQTSIRDATRALELLARISGMFVNRQEIELNALPVVIRDDI